MTSPQTDIQAQLSELSSDSFEAFCNDISGMFGVEMASHATPASDVSRKSLEKEYKKLAAVFTVHARGLLDGDFHLIMDKEALFTLAGTIVMLPEERIVANRKSGSTKEAQELQDAVGETGNLLVGSWDRIFREDLEGHIHFLQTGTFIGNPWDDAACPLAVGDDPYLYFPHEMTVGSFPPFKCGVIFPEAVYIPKPVAETEPQEAPPEPETDAASPGGEDEPSEPIMEPEAVQSGDSDNLNSETAAADTVSADADDDNIIETSPSQTQDTPCPDKQPLEQSNNEIPCDEPINEVPQPESKGVVSQAIEDMVHSLPVLPTEHARALLSMPARDLMQTNVLWASPDDSVQQAMQAMQKADAACLLVGDNKKSLEGLITWIDIAEAVSVYLRPVFAKWHRPLDDATLQIRIKVIMARPVRTVRPDSPLEYIMEDMRQHRLRCLPVMNDQGQVEGIVTAFDIFRMLLALSKD